MAENERKRRFFTFPATLMTGWWESYDKFKCCINRGLDYDILNYTYECEFTNVTDDDKVIKAVHESFGLSTWNYDNECHIITRMRKDKEIYNLYHSDDKGVFFSLPKDLFWEFYKNKKSFNDMALLVAYLSIKSLLGKRIVTKTNKYAITARMACNTSLRKTTPLPEEIKKFQSRKRYDRLKRELFEFYKVGFYSDKGIRGTYVTLKRNENNEVDFNFMIEQAEKYEVQGTSKNDPLKEAIKLAKEQRKNGGTSKDT